MGLAHLSNLANTGRGIGTETCKVEPVFPRDDFWFGSDTNTNYAVIYIYIYNLHLDVEMTGYAVCIKMSNW